MQPSLPAALLILCLALTPACAAPGDSTPAIVESIADDGTPVRIEVGDDEDETGSELAEELVRRLEAVTPDEAEPIVALASSFDPFAKRGCPPEGDAKSATKQARNRLKNRTRTPRTKDIDPKVTLAALRAPGDDRFRWSEAKAATIEAFVDDVFATGAESCNCKVEDRALTDTHFDLIASEGDTGQKVIAEITPVWRLLHENRGQEDWSSAAIRKKYQGHRVRITGWLYFDESHVWEADNTDPDDDVGKKNWRATGWEIHPITKLEIID